MFWRLNPRLSRPSSEVELIIETREKRHRYNCLQNDHVDVMRQLESLVLGSSATTTPPTTTTTTTPEALRAFVVVDAVQPTSPAAEAGLLVGDRVLRFGRVNAKSHATVDAALIGVRDLVQANVNRRVSLVVERGAATHVVALTPRAWSGAGLLGCHLTPIAVETLTSTST